MITLWGSPKRSIYAPPFGSSCSQRFSRTCPSQCHVMQSRCARHAAIFRAGVRLNFESPTLADTKSVRSRHLVQECGTERSGTTPNLGSVRGLRTSHYRIQAIRRHFWTLYSTHILKTLPSTARMCYVNTTTEIIGRFSFYKLMLL